MSEIRPDVVQTLVDAIVNPTMQNIERLTQLESVTPAEKAAADSLTLSELTASSDHRGRVVEVWDVLIKRQWDSPPTWEQLFNELTAEDIDRLRDLYEAMPNGARAEFDHRYGRPQL